jgi:hypothetical protein
MVPGYILCLYLQLHFCLYRRGAGRVHFCLYRGTYFVCTGVHLCLYRGLGTYFVCTGAGPGTSFVSGIFIQQQHFLYRATFFGCTGLHNTFFICTSSDIFVCTGAGQGTFLFVPGYIFVCTEGYIFCTGLHFLVLPGYIIHSLFVPPVTFLFVPARGRVHFCLYRGTSMFVPGPGYIFLFVPEFIFCLYRGRAGNIICCLHILSLTSS